MPGSFSPSARLRLEKEADWMERRVRTMSSGYVHVTEVMPARPPQSSRWYASSGAPGSFSKNWGWVSSVHCCCTTLETFSSSPTTSDIAPETPRAQPERPPNSTPTQEIPTHPFIHIIRTKLHGRIRHDPYAIRAIARHEASPPLFPPHLGQRLGNRHLVLLAPHALHLEQDLQPLERRHYCPRDRAGHTARDEGCEHRLRESLPYALERCEIWGERLHCTLC